jgi:hypothetical protein
MPVPILCPFCGVSGSVPENKRGSSCRCPKCGNRFKVPELVSAPEIKPLSSPPPIQNAVTQDPFDFDRQPILEAQPVDDSVEKRPSEKFCIECGAIIRERAAICPKCGVSQPELQRQGDLSNCPYCRTTFPPLMQKKISPAGWVVFGAVLSMGLAMCITGLCFWPLMVVGFVCLPLSVMGILITTEVRVCSGCGAKLGESAAKLAR